MSLACSKEYTLKVVAGCLMLTCETKASSPLAGGEHMNERVGFAFAPDRCYCAFIAHKSDYTETYFYKYDPATNTVTKKATMAYDSDGNLLYHPTQKKFVFVTLRKVTVFDPVTETITDTFAVPNYTFCALYVPEKDLIYANSDLDGSGNHGMAAIDIVARTCTRLAWIPVAFGGAHPYGYDYAYCPVNNCLYGPFVTGVCSGLLKFDLTTNTTTFIYLDLGASICWDSDRSLLVVVYGLKASDVNPLTDTIVRETYSAQNIQYVRGASYVSSLRKVFAYGYDNDTPDSDGVIIQYDPSVPSVTRKFNDTGYTMLDPVSGTSFMAAVYDLVSSVEGAKKLCMT